MKREERYERLRVLREQKRTIEAEIGQLEFENRREFQTEELGRNGGYDLPAFGGASINSYCDDLVYHAKRLNRMINGEFNGVALNAYPDTDPNDLIKHYCKR